MSGTVMPIWRPQFLDNNGAPLASGSVEAFAAGTPTPLTVYTDAALGVALGTSFTLNAGGFPQTAGGVESGVFLTPVAHKFVLKNSAGTTVRTLDNVVALQPATSVNLEIDGVAGETLVMNNLCYLSDGSAGTTAGRWYKADQDLGLYAGMNPLLAFVTSAVATGAAGLFRRGGSMDGFSGLTAGVRYYVGSTAGAITASPTNWARAVGVGRSATELVIDMSPQWDGIVVATGQTTTAVGNQDNFTLSAAATVFLRCNNATALTLRGLAVPSAGRRIDIISIGAGAITLANENANSLDINRITTGTGADVTLPAGARATLLYDDLSARWLLLRATITNDRAWASVANSGSPSLTAGVNVASVTDNGVGDTTVTFTTALPSANYAAAANPESATADKSASIHSKATGSVRVQTITASTGAALDVNFSVQCQGG